MKKEDVGLARKILKILSNRGTSFYQQHQHTYYKTIVIKIDETEQELTGRLYRIYNKIQFLGI